MNTKYFKSGAYYDPNLGKHEYYGRGARTKGYILNGVKGEKRLFLYNPSEISFSRSANYSEIKSPGLSNPLTQYINGNSMQFKFPLFLYDKPYSGLIPNWQRFLDNFLPPDWNNINFKKPDWLMIAMGNFIHRCVVMSIDYSYTEFNQTLYPTVGTITLNLKSLGGD